MPSAKMLAGRRKKEGNGVVPWGKVRTTTGMGL